MDRRARRAVCKAPRAFTTSSWAAKSCSTTAATPAPSRVACCAPGVRSGSVHAQRRANDPDEVHDERGHENRPDDLEPGVAHACLPVESGSEAILHAEIRTVALGLVLEQPPVEVPARRARRGLSPPRLDPPVLEARLH